MDAHEIYELYFAESNLTEDQLRETWKYEVQNGDTVLGFGEWLQHQAEMNDGE